MDLFMPARPKDVDISLSQGVTITWDDGHLSRYPIKYLRESCPCATCTNAHGDGGPVSTKPAAPANPLVMYQPVGATLKGVEPVGRYALQFYFSDDHSHGIFTWDYLRELCPCDACRAAAKTQ